MLPSTPQQEDRICVPPEMSMFFASVFPVIGSKVSFKLRIIHTEAEQIDISMLKGIATKCNLLQEIIPCEVRRF